MSSLASAHHVNTLNLPRVQNALSKPAQSTEESIKCTSLRCLRLSCPNCVTEVVTSGSNVWTKIFRTMS